MAIQAKFLASAPQADLTVTFFRYKPGHWLYPGHQRCGKLVLTDIGIPDSVLAALNPSASRNSPRQWAFPTLASDTHKYRRGHCRVAAGQMPGAARLAAHAALRARAGLVSVAAAPEGMAQLAGMPAAVIQRACPDLPTFARMAAEQKVSSIVLGPGAGTGGRTRRRVEAGLRTGKPTVLDADALSAFVDEPHRLFLALATGNALLTPHEAEFARLFDKPAGSKLDRVRAAAAECGAVVLLKGPDTVIASPDGQATINTNAPPWLATAGSGDVLAGLIGGLMAQGMSAYNAACAGAWLHGEAARQYGRGLIADGLPNKIPSAMAQARMSG
jgi:NAD(P)H-hydrate epimerase